MLATVPIARITENLADRITGPLTLIRELVRSKLCSSARFETVAEADM